MDGIIITGCSAYDREAIARALETARLITLSRVVILVKDIQPEPEIRFKKFTDEELDMPELGFIPRKQKDRRTIKEHRAAMRRKL